MIFGAILAGGHSSRMGADKAEAMLGGRSLLSHVVERIKPQVDQLAIVGGQPKKAHEADCHWLPDALPQGKGPLAGILAALEWAHDAQSDAASAEVVICAVDMPFLPMDLARKLMSARAEVEICFARYGGRTQYLASVWRPGLAPALREFLKDAENLSIRAFAAQSRTAVLEFGPSETGPPDPFANLNTPEDLAAAEQWLRQAL